MSAHPGQSELAVLSTSGLLERWDYTTATRLAGKQLGDGATPTCLTYSKDGSLICVGFASGYINILSTSTLDVVFEGRNSGNRIVTISMSPDSKRLALANSAHQVRTPWNARITPALTSHVAAPNSLTTGCPSSLKCHRIYLIFLFSIEGCSHSPTHFCNQKIGL